MKNEIQRRLESENWDREIANLVIKKINQKKKLKYTLFSLTLCIICFVLFFIKLNLDSYELEISYRELLEENSIEELTSLLE